MKKPLVLIIDDQPGIRMLLEETFKTEMVEIKTAENGDKALDLIKKYHSDIIFLDINMPKRSGLDILQELKTSGFKGAVVLMTGFFFEEDDDVDVDYILKKPFDIIEAIEVLHTFLEKTHTNKCYIKHKKDFTNAK
jgi:two-component system response regulator (stage 0 sporulation protein F)